MSQFRDLVDQLKIKVRSKWPPYNSWHEAHSVLREEFEEFWDEVKRKEGERDLQKLLSELVDIVQVCERAAEDFNLVPTEPATHDDRESYYAAKYTELSNAVQNFLATSQQVKLNIQQVRPANPHDRMKVGLLADQQRGKIISLMAPLDSFETLENLVENDRILPA